MVDKFKHFIVALASISTLCLAFNSYALYNIENGELLKDTRDKFNITLNREGNNKVLSLESKTSVMSYLEECYSNISKDSVYVDFMDISKPSRLTNIDYAKVINGTALEGYGYVFEKAEKEYSVNGVFLLGLVILESGWGTSQLATTKNNYTGMSAYDGTELSSGKIFKGLEECVMYTAERLSTKYLTDSGMFYISGKSIFDMNIYYCSQINWSLKIIDVIEKYILKEII